MQTLLVVEMLGSYWLNMDKHYYSNHGVRLYLGDCIQILETLPAESIDMIFADPPYRLSNNGFSNKGGKRVSVNKGDWDISQGIINDFNFHEKWILACRRVLKPNGTIWISGTYHSIYACGYALQKNNFHILNDISWFKPNASPNLSKRFFTASHENLIWARKHKQAKHTFHYDKMRNGDFTSDILKNPNKQMRSVWAIPHTPKKEKTHGNHPTQKPLKLLHRIISACTNKNDIILDPFCGSGTTGVIAKQLNRNFVGIDIKQEFLKISTLRIYEK